MVDESGLTPEPEKMGEKVPTYRCSMVMLHYWNLKVFNWALTSELIFRHTHEGKKRNWICNESSMQVLPDLTKFMDSIHARMMTVHKMVGQLESEAPDFPAAAELLAFLVPNHRTLHSWVHCFVTNDDTICLYMDCKWSYSTDIHTFAPPQIHSLYFFWFRSLGLSLGSLGFCAT